jgi:hypothetical protein
MSSEECGHSFHVVKKTPFHDKKHLLNIILQEKINALANATPPKQMSTVQKLEYADAWQVANGEMLNDVGLGQNCIEGGEETFVTGLFISTAAAKNLVPLLQRVYQADEAHINFGNIPYIHAMASLPTATPFLLRLALFWGTKTGKYGDYFGSL